MALSKWCFILLSHFVRVKDFELLWSTSHLKNVPLMLEYLRIFCLIFFVLNQQKKVKCTVGANCRPVYTFLYRFDFKYDIIPRLSKKSTFPFRLKVVWPPLWPKYAESAFFFRNILYDHSFIRYLMLIKSIKGFIE